MSDMVIIPRNAPRNTLRAGVVVRNEETEKVGIYGLPATDSYQGPYALKAQEVIP